MVTIIVALYSYTCESGKDTCADFIHQWCESRALAFTRAAFADEMKLVCARALGIEGDRESRIATIDHLKLHGEVHALAPGTYAPAATMPRQYGSNGGRDFIIGLAEGVRALDPMFWIRHATTSTADIHALTDLRFQPEADWVSQNGGKIIEIVRPDTTHVNEDRVSPHEIDCVIHNVGSLDAFRSTVFKVMDHLVP